MIVLDPVFVTVEPPSTRKLDAVPNEGAARAEMSAATGCFEEEESQARGRAAKTPMNAAVRADRRMDRNAVFSISGGPRVGVDDSRGEA
jgi:hypothetical protein